MFITFEGVDRSGKTLQAGLLAGALEAAGRRAFLCREPGGTIISEKIREILLDRQNAGMAGITEALLYAAARAQFVAEVIRPKLAEGFAVICDRFADSSVAYQGYARGLGPEIVRDINSYALAGLKPDITFFMDIAPERAARRERPGEPDRIESEGLAFQRAVYEGYRAIAGESGGRVRVINADRPAEEIHEEIFGVVREFMFSEARVGCEI